MAKGDSSTSQTPPKTDTQPQQNQYLQGNPSTNTQANTLWMNPSDRSSNTGINGGGDVQQTRNSAPLTNGTMIGQISSGNVGQYMPGGYDQGKFSDPNKHDPKYDVGRILSKYPPGPEGLQAAAPELQQLGYRVVGKDKIQGPAGLIDVGQSFSDPNAQHSWYWSGDLNAPGGGQNNSMLGMPQQNQNNFLQQMFEQLMARRNMFANQQFNPTGGWIPANAPGANPNNSILTTSFGPSGMNPGFQYQPMMQAQDQRTMIGQPNPDSNGLFGGWQDANGVRHPGNQPGMSYMT